MIDEYSADGTGWALFSEDRRYRYRLARSLNGKRLVIDLARSVHCLARVVFLMLNPSTADAFVLDPTVRRCAVFARNWGADVLEVVNLFPLRSPYPEDLLPAVMGMRAVETLNDLEIRRACEGAARVIVAWGNHGVIDGRDSRARSWLQRCEIPYHHLGLSKLGNPLHPIARGKSMIPYNREPVLWG